MAYAMVPHDLEIPPVESLKRAFKAVTCLTDLDAHTLARDAFGILVRGLSAKDASDLKGALRVEGVNADLVDDKALPAARTVPRLDCSPDALKVYDPMGRHFDVDWNHIMWIASGQVNITAFQRIRTEKPAQRFQGFIGGFYSLPASDAPPEA